MTPEERDLILSVFQRLQQVAGAAKDEQANALIADAIRHQPDAPYGLVQAVLVQENALKQLQSRCADLERRLAQAPAAAQGSGGFLPAGSNPWVQSAPVQQGPAPSYPQQAYQQAAPGQAVYGQSAPGAFAQPTATATGGFLRNAATAAAGVAGGVLLAEGISSLFTGHHGGGAFGAGSFGGGGYGGAGFGGAEPEVVENVVVNNYYGDTQGTTQPASYDTNTAWSGNDTVDGDTGSDDSWM